MAITGLLRHWLRRITSGLPVNVGMLAHVTQFQYNSAGFDTEINFQAIVWRTLNVGIWPNWLDARRKKLKGVHS